MECVLCTRNDKNTTNLKLDYVTFYRVDNSNYTFTLCLCLYCIHREIQVYNYKVTNQQGYPYYIGEPRNKLIKLIGIKVD